MSIQSLSDLQNSGHASCGSCPDSTAGPSLQKPAISDDLPFRLKVHRLFRQNILTSSLLYYTATIAYTAHRFCALKISLAALKVFSQISIFTSAISGFCSVVIDSIEKKEVSNFSKSAFLLFAEEQEENPDYQAFLNKHKPFLKNLPYRKEDISASENFYQHLKSIAKKTTDEREKKAEFLKALLSQFCLEYGIKSADLEGLKNSQNFKTRALLNIVKGESLLRLQETIAPLFSDSANKDRLSADKVLSLGEVLKTQAKKAQLFLTISIIASLIFALGALSSYLAILYAVGFLPVAVAVAFWWGGWSVNTFNTFIARGYLAKTGWKFSILEAVYPRETLESLKQLFKHAFKKLRRASDSACNLPQAMRQSIKRLSC